MNKSRIAINNVFFMNGFVFANWAARIPLLQDNFQISHQHLGFVLLSASIGALVAMPFTGWLISKRGSKRITQISAVLFLFSVPLFTLSPNYIGLLFAFFLMGMTTGTLDVAMNAQAVVIEQQLNKPIMSFFHAMFSAGMMIGAGVGALFSHLEWNLFSHFSLVVFAALFLLLWSVRHMVEDEVDESAADTQFFKLPDASLVGIGVIAFCCMLGEGAMSDWSSNYMTKVVGAERSVAPFGLFAFSLAMMIGRFLGDRARVQYGDQMLLLSGGFLATIGMLIAILFPTTIIVVFGLFLVGIGLSTIVPIVYSQAGNLPNLSPGVGIGMITTIGYFGFLFGPPVIGFLADIFSLRIAFVYILGLFVSMTLLSFIRRKHKTV